MNKTTLVAFTVLQSSPRPVHESSYSSRPRRWMKRPVTM